MNSWYIVKVKFTKEFQDGSLKRVTEPYLVNALSFTESESRIYEEVGEFIRGEFTVVAIAKADFADIFHYDDADIWHKCKVRYVTEDADSGKEKKVTNSFLVSAPTTKEAYNRIQESLKEMMVSFEIPAVTETDIVEVFPFESSQSERRSKAKKKASNEEE